MGRGKDKIMGREFFNHRSHGLHGEGAVFLTAKITKITKLKLRGGQTNKAGLVLTD